MCISPYVCADDRKNAGAEIAGYCPALIPRPIAVSASTAASDRIDIGSAAETLLADLEFLITFSTNRLGKTPCGRLPKVILLSPPSVARKNWLFKATWPLAPLTVPDHPGSKLSASLAYFFTEGSVLMYPRAYAFSSDRRIVSSAPSLRMFLRPNPKAPVI